jgi:PAS domain-containing protein
MGLDDTSKRPRRITSQASRLQTKAELRKRPRTPLMVLESEEWLFTTLRSIGDAVIVTDAEGFIVFMNPVAGTLTGWPERDALGKDCHEALHIVSEETRRLSENLTWTHELPAG